MGNAYNWHCLYLSLTWPEPRLLGRSRTSTTASSSPLPPTMLSGILVFNQKGENLIFRAFRNDCRPRLADIFRIQVISNPQVRSPILTLGSTTFSHVKHENIYLVAVTKSNANAALIFEFLYRLVTLGKSYFGKFDEEAVKNNFVLIYELLDGRIIRSIYEYS
jgi:AP-2 complex subunit mu-1